jgi:PAS domain S-box-containing protein
LTSPRSPLAVSVSDLPWGTHLCHFYATSQDLLDTLVPFFRAGLEKNEYCLWAVSPSLTIDDATAALRSSLPDVDRYVADGRLEIVPSLDWYLKDGRFDATRVLQSWLEKLDAALTRGHTGMRANGNEDWLRPDLWPAFAAYERSLDDAIRGRPMVVLCSYPLGEGAIQILDVAREHQFALAKRRGAWEVLETPELRVAEEQARHRELFETSHDVILLVDPEGRILDVNRRGEQVTGYSHGQLLSMNVIQHLALADDQPVVTQMLEDVEDRGVREFRVRWRTSQGDTVHLDGSAVARRARTGQTVAVFCILRDVTERTKSDLAMRERVEAAREEERTRIARELHDELGSTLTRVRWDLEALEKDLTGAAAQPDDSLHERFAVATGLVDATIDSVRRIASELRPAGLDDLGLVAALEMQVQQFQRATGVTCRLDVLLDDGYHLPGEQSSNLFRIVQEALTNVSRHARATVVNIVLEERDGELTLEIRDNGVGIPPAALTSPTALGLIGIRERAALVGGTVEISTPGKGTVVAVRLRARSLPRQES